MMRKTIVGRKNKRVLAREKSARFLTSFAPTQTRENIVTSIRTTSKN